MAKKTLKDLLDELALKSAEAETASKAGDTEQRNLNQAEFDTFNALMGEVRALQTQVDQARSIESFQAGRATTIGSGEEGNRDTSKADRRGFAGFNLNKALLDTLDGRALSGIEGEVTQEGEKRAIAEGIDLAGNGFVVMDEVLQMRGQTATGQTSNAGDQGGVFVEKQLQGVLGVMQANTFLSEVGARFLTGLTGNPEFPVQESVPAIQELTEIEAMTDTEILFSTFGMSPKRRGVTIPVSRQLLKQSSIDMQGFVIDAIGEAFSQKLNVEAITALLTIITSGNGNLKALGTDGLAPTYLDIVALETLVDVANHLKATPKYLTNAKVKGKLKGTQKFASTNGDPVWKDNTELNGYKAVTSNLVPSNITKGSSTSICSAIVFGNFNDFIVGRWGGVEYIIDPYSAKRKAQIEVTANAFWDMKPARVKSFSGIKDALTT